MCWFAGSSFRKRCLYPFDDCERCRESVAGEHLAAADPDVARSAGGYFPCVGQAFLSLADRFSGRQHSGLFNTTTMAYPDPNPNVYGGRSTFNVIDAKVLYKVSKQWSAAVGVNNIGNLKYFTLYLIRRRTLFASLKFDM